MYSSRWLRMVCEMAWATSTLGDLHSITAKGMPLTNSTTSGRQVSTLRVRSTANSAAT
jgi:hypothetical protein